MFSCTLRKLQAVTECSNKLIVFPSAMSLLIYSHYTNFSVNCFQGNILNFKSLCADP